MPAIEITAATAIAPARLHAVFTEAFADYLIGPFRLAPAQWPEFLARQGVDLAASRVALRDGAPIAFCLVAPRPDCDGWRLATMGALAAARGSGAAPALLDDFVARAQAAGVAAVELECFAQNTRALRLYTGRGFAQVDALYGYSRIADAAPAPGTPGTPVTPPDDSDLPAAWDWLAACGEACQLPFQVTAPSLRALPHALRAWRRGTAQLVFSEGADGSLQVHSLVDRAPGQQDAGALVAALLAAWPRRTVRVPQLQRHAVGGAALERLGFERLPLHQLWLRRPLATP